mgnify:CR=1 FL=1
MVTFDETEVLRFHPAKVYFLKDFALGVLLLPIFVGWYFLGRALVGIFSAKYVVTTKRVIATRGLLSVCRSEIRISDIQTVDVYQSFSQRILGIGTVAVYSAVPNGVGIRMTGISNPLNVVESINTVRGR